MEQVLWYREPATEWMEGLPVGNGRLAAMVFGDEQQDILALNHEWLWRGLYRNRDNAAAAEWLEPVRSLLKSGDFFAAAGIANTVFGGRGGISQLPNRVDAYQPAGHLHFAIDQVENYVRRDLDLTHGIAGVNRETAGGEVRTDFIVHPELNLIIGHWAGNFSGRLYFDRAADPDAEESCQVSRTGIDYQCQFRGGIAYRIAIRLETDGAVSTDGQKITINQAGELTVVINIATSVRGIAEELAAYPVTGPFIWPEMLASHRRKYAAIMERLALHVDIPDNPASTGERIAAVKAGGTDDALPWLYFHYGRYLMIASSICGELPANLQGKWNDSIHPPWECDYHFDINLQMNYWLTEPAGLSECTEALFRYVERFLLHARKAARDLYGCRGVLLPLQTDAWGRATPESYGWAVWIGAAPWIAQHFWWHYLYTGDRDFLRRRAYPFFQEIARFYEDYLVRDEQGIYQIMPSQSPENRFNGTGHFPVSIGISSAMDVQLAYDALGYAIRSADLLQIDADDRDRWQDMQDHLPDFRIGSDGRLLEWDCEREEVEPGHRHLSHLYGLYPSDLFNPNERPAQYAAAIRSLHDRLERGGGHTGWSRAWVACLSARIGDGDQVWEHLNGLIKDFATVSLLDLHPPRIFQIDGNFGAVAAVLESLAQFWNDRLHLLRALPPKWKTGRLEGLRVPGGHELSFSWQNGQVEHIEGIIGYAGELLIAGLGGHGEDLVIRGKPGDAFQHRFGMIKNMSKTADNQVYCKEEMDDDQTDTAK